VPDPYPRRRSVSSRRLLKDIPSEAEIANTLRNLKNVSDFTLAITGTAYLQHMTERILKSRFVRLSKEDERRMFDGAQNGFLSSFSSQIRLCFALGLVDHASYEDLLMLNDIRNIFAHSMHEVDFNNTEVENDLKLLHFQVSGAPPSEEVKKRPGFYSFHNAVLVYATALRGISIGMKITTIEELQLTSKSLFAAGS